MPSLDRSRPLVFESRKLNSLLMFVRFWYKMIRYGFFTLYTTFN